VSQGIGGHEGYSGTPMWKIAEQNRQQREALLEQQESLNYVLAQRKAAKPPNVVVEAVSAGSVSGKSVTKHVIVKDLRKVAGAMKVDLPASGIFDHLAPIGLYALFDGQSCAGPPGPVAAEYCARNFHKKVLENVCSLPANCTSDTFVKAALVKSFEDLDKDLLEALPDTEEGCGAAVALLVGEYLFTAVLGACDGVLCEAGNASARPVPLGRSQGRCHIPEERSRLLRAGSAVVGEGKRARVVGPAGTSPVSRSLGDPQWKTPSQGSPVLSCIPEIQSHKLSWADRHASLLLVARPVAEALEPQEMMELAMVFPAQPRAACGEIVAKVSGTPGAGLDEAQCTAIEVWFLPGGSAGGDAEGGALASQDAREPAKKKAKAGGAPPASIQSARLRHILVRFQDGPASVPSLKKAGRTRTEAEALLRRLLRELKAELDERRSKQAGQQSGVMLRSDKFMKLCKEHSECPTAQKGGGMCGDLGWVSRDQQRKLGAGFQEAVSVLRPGDWSDIALSTDGLHIIQRIA